MKKIFTLVICLFLLTGCFNYVEINNIVLVSGIGINYINNEYKISFELLDHSKGKSESNVESGILKIGQGKTIPEAFDDISLKLEKEPYLAHLKVVVISEEIAKKHMNDLFDFFLRNNDIRNIFTVVISKNASPEEVLSKTNEYYKVSSERIKSLLDNNIYSNYISKNKYFKNIASNFLSGKKNITLSTIIIDNDELKLGNIGVFNKNKLVDYLSNDEALILSLIDNKKTLSDFKYECEKDKYIIIRAYKSNTNFKIKENIFKIKNNINAEIIENSCNYNLENIKLQKELEKTFEKIINDKVYDLISHLKIINSDILGINNKYYINFKKNKKDYFKNTNYKIETNININKKGLIFEVKNDK